jgi:hypothetical protein
MNTGRTVFAQLMDFFPLHEFRKSVARYRGHHKVQSFSCLDQFLSMAFAQLTFRESLRDIETCLRAMQPRLYHLGIRSKVSRSTLADANESRDWRIYADTARHLMATARMLYRQEPFAVEIGQAAYVLDATLIDLCLSLFPWARFHSGLGAVKLHTLLDLRGNIPVNVYVTRPLVNEIHLLDQIVPEPGAFYIMDRGYLDFERFRRLHMASAFFVTRWRHNASVQRLYSNPTDKAHGVLCDQTVRLGWIYSRQSYPDPLRRIRYLDPASDQRLVFLTNNFLLPAFTIAQLYKCRWQVELFFKWIKQHLRIKAFYGTSENAVKTQLWIALCVYLLVAIVKKQLGLPHSLYTILQVLSVTLFEKAPILQALSHYNCTSEISTSHNQLTLFNL